MRCDSRWCATHLVCREHEFFDQAVRDVAFGARDGPHQAEFVELDDWLGEIEVDGSAALALAVQDHGQVAHQFEVRDQRGVALAQRRSPSRMALTAV